jgi:hypothetical protein
MHTLKNIRIKPFIGKYAEISTSQYGTVRVWETDPNDHEPGTVVNYDVARYLLSMSSPVVNAVLVQDPDGKYVSPLSKEDLERVNTLRKVDVSDLKSKVFEARLDSPSDESQKIKELSSEIDSLNKARLEDSERTLSLETTLKDAVETIALLKGELAALKAASKSETKSK